MDRLRIIYRGNSLKLINNLFLKAKKAGDRPNNTDMYAVTIGFPNKENEERSLVKQNSCFLKRQLES